MLTDNEIKRALLFVAHYCHDEYNEIRVDVLLLYALDLINRQQAEIERLKKESEILSINADTAFQDGLNEAQDLYAKQVKAEIKSEAIKEFAERLKSIYTSDKRYDRPNPHTLLIYLFANIDNLVKEMVGEG